MEHSLQSDSVTYIAWWSASSLLMCRFFYADTSLKHRFEGNVGLSCMRCVGAAILTEQMEKLNGDHIVCIRDVRCPTSGAIITEGIHSMPCCVNANHNQNFLGCGGGGGDDDDVSLNGLDDRYRQSKKPLLPCVKEIQSAWQRKWAPTQIRWYVFL
jgi:hypothetical protein